LLSRSRRHQVCVSRRPRTNKLRTERDSVEGRRKEVESNGVYWEKFESRGVGERLPKVFGVSNERRRFLAKKSVLMYKEDYHYYSLRPRARARKRRRDGTTRLGKRNRKPLPLLFFFDSEERDEVIIVYEYHHHHHHHHHHHCPRSPRVLVVGSFRVFKAATNSSNEFVFPQSASKLTYDR
jgi:hypothetical protein